MTDRVLTAFLERQLAEGMALAEASDLLRLIPLPGDPPRKYIADFRCKGLVKSAAGEIVEAERFVVGIWFADGYLREVDPCTALTWLEPHTIFHPNVSAGGPFICLGRIGPGTSLVELAYRCFELLTYNKVTMREDDALNREACAWARHNLHRIPVDRRALKRRARDGAIDFDVDVIEVRG